MLFYLHTYLHALSVTDTCWCDPVHLLIITLLSISDGKYCLRCFCLIADCDVMKSVMWLCFQYLVARILIRRFIDSLSTTPTLLRMWVVSYLIVIAGLMLSWFLILLFFSYQLNKIAKTIKAICLFLADHNATQYDWLLASSCHLSVCPSVCLSVTLCIVALRVSVQG